MHEAIVEQQWRNLWFARFGPKDIRLRFELGGDLDNIGQHVPRFIQAHRRACIIADEIFAGSCVGIVAWLAHSNPLADDASVKIGFQALKATGFNAPQIATWHADPYPDEENDGKSDWTFRCYDLTNDKIGRDVLLWHSVAAEMPIFPSAQVISFLLDPMQRVLLHVYDDRGLDLSSEDASMIGPIYSKLNHWLLDFDRERMAQLF